MLTITHPEIFPELAAFPGGLWPLRGRRESALRLIIKCPKECILAAKMNHGFRFYLAPLKANGVQTYGLITAFFDDHDEPLTLWSPLFDDEMTVGIRQLLSSDEFDVHFFDEHDRELLGYRVRNEGAAQFRTITKCISFLPFTYQLARQFLHQMPYWFSLRTSVDDNEALPIIFEAALFPDDIYIQDLRPEANSYHGSKAPMHTILERRNAGYFSELDIVKALQRLFPSDQTYLNPNRPDDRKEFADILAVTPRNLFLIQAKDSPNTERVLQRSIERKKATVVSHLRKAIDQMRGSISYIRRSTDLKFVVGDHIHEISLESRDVIGLILVKELFNSEFAVYSPPVLRLFNETGVPCFILDYPEFHRYTLHLRTEESLLDALERVFVVAQERGEFPRLRFGLNPPS